MSRGWGSRGSGTSRRMLGCMLGKGKVGCRNGKLIRSLIRFSGGNVKFFLGFKKLVGMMIISIIIIIIIITIIFRMRI